MDIFGFFINQKLRLRVEKTLFLSPTNTRCGHVLEVLSSEDKGGKQAFNGTSENVGVYILNNNRKLVNELYSKI